MVATVLQLVAARPVARAEDAPNGAAVLVAAGMSPAMSAAATVTPR
jgi:hypothetical protein